MLSALIGSSGVMPEIVDKVHYIHDDEECIYNA